MIRYFVTKSDLDGFWGGYWVSFDAKTLLFVNQDGSINKSDISFRSIINEEVGLLEVDKGKLISLMKAAANEGSANEA